jgi:hypothetical protein
VAGSGARVLLPVVTLGFGAALTHLLRDDVAEDVPEVVSILALNDEPEAVAPTVPDAVATPPVPEVDQAVARRARRRLVSPASRAERKYAGPPRRGQAAEPLGRDG